MPNAPKSIGPPCSASNSLHIATMRATFSRNSGCSASTRAPTSGSAASMFIPNALRMAPKPECISAQTQRARARARASVGHSCLPGKRSARYSAIASVSQTARPSSTSTGTRPAGLRRRASVLNFEPGENASKRSITSSNGMPAWVISTHGRIDHEE